MAEAIDAGGVVISWINLGEVFYTEVRAVGEAAAAAAVEELRASIRTKEPDAETVLAAARIKSRHRLSYADAFAVATAEHHRLPLLTGDPEILALDRPLTVVDLRRDAWTAR